MEVRKFKFNFLCVGEKIIVLIFFMFNLGEDKFQFHSFRVFQFSNMEVDKFNMDKHMEGMTRAVEQVLSDPRVFIF